MLERITPTVARDLLSRHGIRPARGRGQNFLVDPNTARRIVRLSGLSEDDAVLEIGPGLGSLTVVLASSVRRVAAVELDEAVARALAEVLSGAPNVEVVVADAMRADLGRLCGEKVRLVANLPYSVATPLVLRILEEVPEVTGGLVMVQRELGERWSAAPGGREYGSTSVRVAYDASARVVGSVPPSVFLPRPKVSSVLVSLERHRRPPVEVGDRGRFFAFVRAAFAHRRKTLPNALASYDRDAVVGALRELGLPERARAQELDLGELAALHGRLEAV